MSTPEAVIPTIEAGAWQFPAWGVGSLATSGLVEEVNMAVVPGAESLRGPTDGLSAGQVAARTEIVVDTGHGITNGTISPLGRPEEDKGYATMNFQSVQPADVSAPDTTNPGAERTVWAARKNNRRPKFNDRKGKNKSSNTPQRIKPSRRRRR